MGVNQAQIDFLDLFLLDCLLNDSPRIGDDECQRLDDNYKDVVASGRWQELSLCRGGQRVPVGPAARELLEQLQPLAELLDSWGESDTYCAALATQRDKLQGDDWSVPSAQVLDAMSGAGLGHRDWVMDISRQHQQTLRNEGLASDVLADYQAMTENSLAEQKTQEEADTRPFSEFLEEYLRA